MSYFQCCSDISTSVVSLQFNLKDGDSLSDLNSYLHWSNSHSNLELHDEADLVAIYYMDQFSNLGHNLF